MAGGRRGPRRRFSITSSCIGPTAFVGTSAEDELTAAFLSDFFVTTPLDRQVAEIAVDLRRTHRAKLPDCIVWATVLANGTVLVTRNTRDFPPHAEGIRVPYEL